MVDDIVLRISKAREQDRCVLQIGTNSGDSAAKVAKMVGTDVAAIDVNMGCPKPFSIHRGMGAALLTQVEKVKEILTSLKSVAQVPVSCKIRVLDDQAETLNLVREIEKCGVAALGVHARRRDERDPHPCRVDEIREIARTVSIPVIANGGSGEISSYEDILKFRTDTGTSSVMLARKALSCPSIFRREGVLPFDEDIKSFLERACEFDENYTMTKYVVQRILGGKQETDPRGKQTVLAGSNQEICRAWGMENKYEECRRARLRMQCKRSFTDGAEDY
ncbi:dihydrouridine synthase, partial [Oesophagostomum dentatum]